MKSVLLVTNFVSIPGEKYYNRTLYLYDLLTQKGYNVTMITCVFNHYDKVFRNISKFTTEYPHYNFIFLKAPGYKRNISLKRIINHKIFVINLKKWLEVHGRQYDVIYATMPTQESVNVTGKYCYANNIPFIIDVRDLWPEAMKLVIKQQWLQNILFWNMKRLANKAYSQADEIVAVSNEYLQRALKANNKSKNPAVVFLGSTMERFDNGINLNYDKIPKPDNEFWIIYIGTLGVSYDVKTLISAYNELKIKGYSSMRLKILGKGPLEEEFKEYAQKINADVDFLGYMDYEIMAAYLKKSDVAVNAIKRNAAQSIINKVADYFSAGIPVLNGSLCKEMQDLISDYNTGLNYEPENSNDLCNKLEELYNNSAKCAEYGKNSRKLAQEHFDRKTSYLKIIDMIENVVKQKVD